MKVLDLTNIQKDDTYIYYRRTFRSNAVIELPMKTCEYPIEFTIEMDPLGKKTTDITFLESVEYPLLPLIKGIKELIAKFDSEGRLR